MKVIDLHCDLLGCVEDNPNLDFDSPDTNCSVPELKAGGVSLQTFAVAALTKKGSTEKTERQVELYRQLLKRVKPFGEFDIKSDDLHGIFAIENASGLAEEDEPLSKAFERFEAFEEVEKILYVSLTWNHENRFGGGNDSQVGLKEDGKALLEFLDGKKAAIDLSHTSDALAYDILNHIYKKSLEVTPIASHSNFRNVKNIPRNLPDEFAREIGNMGGVIGINFVRRFVGDFCEQIQHGLNLGLEDVLCLGADFYGGIEVPIKRSFPIFEPGLDNASCYPKFLAMLEEKFNRSLTEKIAYKNAFALIQKFA